VTGYLTYDANVARLDDLHRRAGRRLAVRDAVARTRACGAEPITIRRATEADRATLARLAALDSAPAPAGEVLLAEVDGQALGAIEVASGAAIADPFPADRRRRRAAAPARGTAARGDQPPPAAPAPALGLPHRVGATRLA
jgi:hypothetical protein